MFKKSADHQNIETKIFMAKGAWTFLARQASDGFGIDSLACWVTASF